MCNIGRKIKTILYLITLTEKSYGKSNGTKSQ